MDQIHFVPCEPARHTPKPNQEPWQAAAVAKFREIQSESAALRGMHRTLIDREERLIRQRTDARIYRDRLLLSGTATDVAMAKADEKLQAIEQMLAETDRLQTASTTEVNRLRAEGFKALVAVGCIDEDLESDAL